MLLIGLLTLACAEPVPSAPSAAPTPQVTCTSNDDCAKCSVCENGQCIQRRACPGWQDASFPSDLTNP